MERLLASTEMLQLLQYWLVLLPALPQLQQGDEHALEDLWELEEENEEVQQEWTGLLQLMKR